MDDLKTIVNTLSPEAQKEFLLFVERHKEQKSRKDIALFRLLLEEQDLTSEEMMEKLYPEEVNAVAYYALRKRLMQQVSDFIMLKQMREDTTNATAIRGLLSLATYLFGMQQEKIAWSMLRKAERTAMTNDQYELLNAVYNLQIEWAGSEFAEPLETIIGKWQLNKGRAGEEERINIATSLIMQKLNEVRLQDREVAFEPLVQEILQEYDLLDAVGTRPRLLYKLMQIMRSTILVKRDFYSFEPYIIRHYTQMEQQGGFTPPHLYYKLSLLYMIAQTLYRNRKFQDSLRYLEQLAASLSTEQRGLYQEFTPRYVLLSAANHAFLQQNAVAVDLLENLLRNRQLSLQTKDLLNAQLNLSFYYFQQGLFKKANQQLMQIGHSDKWCGKKMGREWVLKKQLSEMILQYELGNIDLTFNKVRAIERSFGDMFRKSSYKNVQSYLKLVKQLLDHPALIKSKEFYEQVDQSLEFMPIEQEDLHYMSFYAWLKSKMLDQPYYQVLLELVNGMNKGEPSEVK